MFAHLFVSLVMPLPAGRENSACLTTFRACVCLSVYQIPCPLECPGCFCLTQPLDRFFGIFSTQSLNRNGHAAQTKPVKTNKITKMAKCWKTRSVKRLTNWSPLYFYDTRHLMFEVPFIFITRITLCLKSIWKIRVEWTRTLLVCAISPNWSTLPIGNVLQFGEMSHTTVQSDYYY